MVNTVSAPMAYKNDCLLVALKMSMAQQVIDMLMLHGIASYRKEKLPRGWTVNKTK